MKSWLKRRKNLGFYGTLLAELRLQDQCDCKNYLQMIFEIFEEILEMVIDDITKENIKMKDPTPPRLPLAATMDYLSTGESYKSYV